VDGGEGGTDGGLGRKLGAGVRIRNLKKAYGEFNAVNDISIDIAPGEFMTFLGPSGSGKTTTMMAIAGFVEHYDGEIRIGDVVIDQLPAHRRNVGVVFQHLALFPHMSVADNIAFPLRMRGRREAEIAAKVASAMALVKMGGFEDRLPAQLSGGQQQRVALARALVFDPPLLLLDEPLGALDRKLRENMQAELRALHDRLGITVVHVTHDQSEAMAISDRIAVINRGRVEQCGTPQELYFRPVNRFVADFVGESVFLEGTVEAADQDTCRVRTADGVALDAQPRHRLAVGGRVSVMIRPERFLLGPDAAGANNRMTGEIRSASFIGDRVRYEIAISAREQVIVTAPNRGDEYVMPPGTRTEIGWGKNDVLLFAEA
jgi:putative spermidine/putrescine transport system ATP-binding protein